MCKLPTPVNAEARRLLSEELRFLYDKHQEFFNTRRDHEWKVFFGMITLVGLSSAALLSYSVRLNPTQQYLWLVCMLVLFLFHLLYQKGVQQRNRADRIVMDEVKLHLCNLMELDDMCTTRLIVDAGNEHDIISGNHNTLLPLYRFRYLWAFFLQNATLFIICIVSCVLAWNGVDYKPHSARSTAFLETNTTHLVAETAYRGHQQVPASTQLLDYNLLRRPTCY